MGLEGYSKKAFEKKEQEVTERETLEAAIQELIPGGASINGHDPKAERDKLFAQAHEEALKEDSERNVPDEWELSGQRLQEKYSVADAHKTESVFGPEQITEQEKPLTLDDIESVETAKGSTYRYLSDGTTQRFKKVEGREYEPQTALVYVPDYAWVQTNAPREVLEKLGENEAMYTETLLEYVQNPRNSDNGAYIIDGAGSIIETNAEITEAEGPLYLALTKGKRAEFQIPVSRIPKMGYMTFDTRRYIDETTGESMRERHLGNAVTKIIRRESQTDVERVVEEAIPDSLPKEDSILAKASIEASNIEVPQRMFENREVEQMPEQSTQAAKSAEEVIGLESESLKAEQQLEAGVERERTLHEAREEEFEGMLQALNMIHPLSEESIKLYRERFRSSPETDPFDEGVHALSVGTSKMEDVEQFQKIGKVFGDLVNEIKRWDRNGMTPLLTKPAFVQLKEGTEAIISISMSHQPAENDVLQAAFSKIGEGLSMMELQNTGRVSYDMDAFRKFGHLMDGISNLTRGVQVEHPELKIVGLVQRSLELRDVFKRKYAAGALP